LLIREYLFVSRYCAFAESRQLRQTSITSELFGYHRFFSKRRTNLDVSW